MRSYKDCLLEYLEEKGFTSLNESWFHYFQKKTSDDTGDFQFLQSCPPIVNQEELTFFHDRVSEPFLIDQYKFAAGNQLSLVYTRIVKRLEQFEDNRLVYDGIEDVESWINFKEQQKNKTIEFDYFKNLKEWMLSKGFDSKKIQSFSDENNLQYSFINSFYKRERDFNAHKPSKFQDSKPIDTKGEVIDLEFYSNENFEAIENEWSDNISNEKASFFSSATDLDTTNSLSNISSIKINGFLDGFRVLELDLETHYDLNLFQSFLSNQNKLTDPFSHKELVDIRKVLSRRIQKIYKISGFDFTIEVDNNFLESDIDLLRSNKFSCFPFYFSDGVEHFKWIDLTDEGNLKIRLKSKRPQNLIIGASLKNINE